MQRTALLLAVGFMLAVITEPALAQNRSGGGKGPGMRRGQGTQQQGMRRGMGPGQGMGRGQHGGGNQRGGGAHGGDSRHDADRELFQFLLQNHDKISRTVKELPNGVETLTQSAVPEIAARIKEHVYWMKQRVENKQPIRMRDPLFAEIFKHADKIKMVYEETPAGIRVIETSNDPYVAKLIQEHAKVVSEFVKRGHAEAMKSHAVPADGPKVGRKAANPVIADHGEVVQLADAAMQPRSGTRLLVDVTRGGDPAELNDALTKVAKYLNIYAGGGADPADVEIAIVFHGDATLAVLNPDAYGQKFSTEGNPNMSLLHQLHEANVDMYVCGQSLISKGSAPEDVAVFIETAVSALTAVVNLQADGYAYLPLGN